MRRLYLGSIVLGLLLAPAPAGARKPMTVPVDARTLGPRIPRHFLGFSGEHTLIRPYLAFETRGIANPVMVQLASNLAAYGGGAPMLRLGGNSSDSLYYADSGLPRLPQEYQGLNAAYLRDIAAYLRATRSPVIVGLNLAVDAPSHAVAWAQAVMDLLPRRRVKAVEIGNEPDNYVLYDKRPAGWGPVDYLRELRRYIDALQDVHPVPPLAGPAFITGYRPEWTAAFRRIAARDVDLLTIHRYPLDAALRADGTRQPVPAKALMQPAASDDLAFDVYSAVRTAARRGKQVRMSESNSVSGGGAAGTSDTFASSLWGADWLFMMAIAGVRGVDFHATSPLYQPFSIGRLPGGGGFIFVRPLYYGMQFFAAATAHRPRLIPSSYPYPYQRGYNMHTFGTYDPVEHVVRVAVINKSGRRQPVRLQISGAHRRGTVERLAAPRLTATTGVTWAGQQYAVPTDGMLTGRRVVEHPRRRGRKTFRIRMPGYGAALLTVRVSRRR